MERVTSAINLGENFIFFGFSDLKVRVTTIYFSAWQAPVAPYFKINFNVGVDSTSKHGSTTIVVRNDRGSSHPR